MTSVFVKFLLLGSIIIFVIGCAVSGPSPLIVSIRSEDVIAIKSLIDEGEDVNALSRDLIGNRYWRITPLVKASITGNLEIMELLIEAGADVNGKDEWGHTPLMAAVAFDHIKAARLLLESGADIDATKPDKTTALMIAAREGNLVITELLLLKGADPNIGLGSGSTALSLADWHGDEAIRKVLIEYGAKADYTIFTGRAAGQDARDKLMEIQTLLKKGLVSEEEAEKIRERILEWQPVFSTEGQPNNGHELTSDTYSVGQTGPAGGIVFHTVDGSSHGMEAAPADLGVSRYGCYGTKIAGAEKIVTGTGKQNTTQILESCFEYRIAARLAATYSLNGYTDWFLPSKDELFLMYLNIGQGSTQIGNVGRFASDRYWSSSQVDDGHVWMLDFNDGVVTGGVKDNIHNVRAVRTF